MERQWDTTDEQYELDECLRRRMGLVLDNLGKPKRDYELIAIWEDNSPIFIPALRCIAMHYITAQHITLNTYTSTYTCTYIHKARAYVHVCVRPCIHAYSNMLIHWSYMHIYIYIYVYIHIWSYVYIYIYLLFIYLQKGTPWECGFSLHSATTDTAHVPWFSHCFATIDNFCLAFKTKIQKTKNQETKKKWQDPTLCHYSPLGVCNLVFFSPCFLGFSVFWFVVGFLKG